MDEKRDEKLDTDEVVIKKGKLLSFLDNFWYHYKWHTIVALFLVFAITVCTLQFCNKKDSDVYVLYAGGYEINRRAQDGDMPEYQTICGVLERVAYDRDGDGEATVSLKDLFVLSDEEMREADSVDGKEVNYGLISENRATLGNILVYGTGNYYLTFLSPAVYEEYRKVGEAFLFTDISTLDITNESAEICEDYAVKLSSLEFYTLPGISKLPPDTLVCLRANQTVVGSPATKKEARAAYEASRETFESIVNYSK